MNYTQLTDNEVRKALEVIGVDSVDALFATIPQRIRLKGPLKLPKGLSEMELLRDVGGLTARNRNCGELVCFLGGGAYDHFIPTIVDAVTSQTEFVTGYTPYQAEASQGILQLFYEFQSMVCMLTGMEVANASLYEGASAVAEAVMMATGATGRRKIVVADSVHPETLQVLHSYAASQEIGIQTIPALGGVVDGRALAGLLDETIAGVVVQSPNFFGCVERLDGIVPLVHAQGALAIVSADPLAAGIMKPPGAFGADIVVGEGQGLGVPLQYGGPYLGLMACREKLIRRVPGRVVGMTKDMEGRRGFCLALQTREQHIKRERATSNICTNQGLLAVRAAVYLAAMGKRGIAEVASQCLDKSHYAAREIAKLRGYELRFAAPFFKEFVVRTTRSVKEAMAACRERGILGGVPLARFDKGLNDCFLLAVTEKRTKEEIDALVAALASA